MEGPGEIGSVEGAWSARVTMRSFMPVTLLVHNSSSKTLMVEVEAEASVLESEAWSPTDGAHVMWSGMLRRQLNEVAPGTSTCHALMACFLCPGEFSVDFTCRFKVPEAEGAQVTTGTSPDSKRSSSWESVLCHKPLLISVSPYPQAVGPTQTTTGAGVDKNMKTPQVSKIGDRVGNADSATSFHGNKELRVGSHSSLE
ncbi:unnamed protein product [Discosporangium mesarthrocarpum]